MPINIRNISAANKAVLFQGGNLQEVSSISTEKTAKNSTFEVRPDALPYAQILELQGQIGRIVYDTTNQVHRLWNGAAWMSLSGTASEVGQRAATYSALYPGINVGELAYVNQSQGTQWLPGTLGGTYYPQGWYLWTGSEWVSDRNSIVNQLQLNVEGLGGKSDIGHGHTKSEISDFNDLDYATAAQGTLAASATQPGDNLSDLNNDAGFISVSIIDSYRSDAVGLIVYSGYLFSTTPIIVKDNDGVLTYAQNVTNLETDWSNRLTLTYI